MTRPVPEIRLVRGLAAALLAAFATAVQAGAPQQEAQAPGWYRLQLGSFEVTALNDGTVALHPHQLLKNVQPSEVRAALARSFEEDPTVTSVNAYLVNTGSKLVLIDTGAAGLFGPTLGRLQANLKAAGYQPDQVDDILITHLHPDHVGGITLDGKAAFPNATVHVDARESAHWLSKENLAKASKDEQGFFQGVQAAAGPYVAAGRWKTYDTAAEIVPGIRPWSYGRTPGHTPGHEGYLVESGGRKLLVWGDVVHFASVQFARPGVTIAFDTNQAQAAATRRKLFRELAEQRILVGAAHISFPGLGYVRQEGGGAYAWVPAGYRSSK